MAQEYKITQISAQTPREWNGPQGTVFYIKVKLEGHDRPVSIGKKSPDALKVGDTVYGTINSDMEHAEDKFKSEQNPSYGGGSSSTASKPAYVPRDDLAIRAQWSIGQAMTAVYNADAGNIAEVELLAGALFHMVDRVKVSAAGSTKDEMDADVAAAIDLFGDQTEVRDSF